MIALHVTALALGGILSVPLVALTRMLRGR